MTQDSKPTNLFDHHMWWILLVSICGFIAYGSFKNQAFPNASIDIKTPRLEIQNEAALLAGRMGFVKTELIASTVFSHNREVKSFLEHEYTQDQANELMLKAVPVWYWATRFCKEFDQEQFSSWISPSGNLVSFAHLIPNDDPLISISHEQARALALDFLHRTEPDSTRYSKLIKDATITKPKRQDHWFTWEDQETDFKKAHMRIYIYVSGDQITTYTKFLHIPESWTREFSRKRSYNSLLGTLASFFVDLLRSSALVFAVWGVLTRNIRWRVAFLGAFLLGGCAALDYLNQLPLLISNYNPTTSFNNYLGGLVIDALTSFFSNAYTGITLFAGAEIAYRLLFPKHLAMENLLTRGGLTDPIVLRGVIVGHLVAGIGLGWLVLYYIAGKKLGYWCPLGIENYQILSDLVPAVSAIAIGVRSSFQEEFACRIVGIFLTMKVFKNFWIANLVQALVWGFAHSFYPQEPAYARGLELTAAGLLSGWILRRYGIIPCIVEHYLINAFFHVEPFLYSSVPELKLSVMPALLVFVIAIACAHVANRLSPAAHNHSLINEQIPFHAEEPVTQSPQRFEYKPLSVKARGILLLLCALGIGSHVALPRGYGINRDAKLSINRTDAISRAKEVLAKHSISANNWMTNASSNIDYVNDTFQYIFEKTNLAQVKNIYDQNCGFHWRVRFFKPLQTEEYSVSLNGQGKEINFAITRGEDETGVSLASDEARKLSENYLSATHPELKGWEFKGISSFKRAHRIDYTVEFSCPKLKVAAAECRVNISVIGDQVGNFAQWWELPDTWRFAREKRTTKDELLTHLRTFNGTIAFVLFILWSYSMLKSGTARFLMPIVVGSIAWMALLAFKELNQFPEFFSYYTTTTPLLSFVITDLARTGDGILRAGIETLLMSALTLGALKILSPDASVGGFIDFAMGRIKAVDSASRYFLFRDGLLIAWAAIAFSRMENQLIRMALHSWSPTVPSGNMSALGELANSGIPFLQSIIEALETPINSGALLIVVVSMVAKFAPNWKRSFVIALLMIAIYYSGDRYWQDYVLNATSYFVWFAFCYAIVVKVARNNYVAYALYFLLTTIVSYVEAIALNGSGLFQPELIALSALLIVPVAIVAIFPIWTSCRQQKTI